MRHVVSCGKNFADIVRQNSPDLGETTEELVLKQVKSAEKAACKPGLHHRIGKPCVLCGFTGRLVESLFIGDFQIHHAHEQAPQCGADAQKRCT